MDGSFLGISSSLWMDELAQEVGEVPLVDVSLLVAFLVVSPETAELVDDSWVRDDAPIESIFAPPFTTAAVVPTVFFPEPLLPDVAQLNWDFPYSEQQSVIRPNDPGSAITTQYVNAQSVLLQLLPQTVTIDIIPLPAPTSIITGDPRLVLVIEGRATVIGGE